MPASSRKSPLTHCARCGWGVRFHRRDGVIVLFGRLAPIEGRPRLVCSVCLGSLPPAKRLALLGRTTA